jgi:hypothetical protein
MSLAEAIRAFPAGVVGFEKTPKLPGSVFDGLGKDCP